MTTVEELPYRATKPGNSRQQSTGTTDGGKRRVASAGKRSDRGDAQTEGTPWQPWHNEH